MEAVESFCKQLDGPDMDVLRELVKVFVERLMAEQADAICGAPYGERSEERVNKRNGYRSRAVDTRVGTIEVGIPKLREGSYFPTWLVEPRRRAERALVAVVAECYVRRRLDPPRRRARSHARDRGHLALPCLGDGQGPGRDGRGVSQPAARRWSLHLRAARCPHPEGPGGRTDLLGAGARRDRRHR